MVKGLELFKSHFEPYKDQYILIGGTACVLLFQEAALPFRETKDLDIVLCLESLNVDFTRAFWKFVDAGGYEMRQRKSGQPEFYRFLKPKNTEYPAMLELFSRRPDALTVPEGQQVIPIPADEDVSSLSAILLNEEYYNLIRTGVKDVDGVPIIGVDLLILLKACAFMDLTNRKAAGEKIDEKNIKKHKNDVFRLYSLLDISITMEIPSSVKEDMLSFLKCMESEKIDLKNLGVKTETKDKVLESLRNFYRI